MATKEAQSTELSDQHRKYVAVETIISALINGFFSLLFVWLFFGDRTHVDLWGARGVAIDFLPQSFVVALMGTLVPALLTRSRLKQGKLAATVAGYRWLPANLFVRALLMAICGTVVGSAIAILLLSTLMSTPLPVLAVYTIKVGYGCLLGGIVTAITLPRALSDLGPSRIEG